MIEPCVVAQFDRDGDGTVSLKELGEFLRTFGQEPTESELYDMVRDVDTDKNGTIDFDEFLEMMSKRMTNKDEDEEIREAFRIFDQDGNGFITLEELEAVMIKLGENLTKDELTAMMHEADLDGDGKIDFDEFVVMMRNK